MVYGDVHLDEKRRVDKRNEHPGKHTQHRQFLPRFGQPTSKFTPGSSAGGGKPSRASGAGKGWFRLPVWNANYAGGRDADEEFSQDEDYPDYEDEDGQPQDAL
eukprot:1762669-Pyramimonas_sp.AAC.1